MQSYIFILLLVIHLIICGLMFLLIKLNIMKCDGIAAFMSIFLPVFGPIMAIVESYYYAAEERQRKKLDVQRLQADELAKSIKIADEGEQEIVPLSEALIVNDPETKRGLMKDVLYDINMSIRMDDDKLTKDVVPLQEALLMNDSRTKRALIMDVLYSNPNDYVAQLSEARTNDDTEVVHYAVTALVELQKNYDLKFQSFFKLREEHPDDRGLLLEFQKVLENYIASGLLTGSSLDVQLRNYQNILNERLEKEPTNFSLYYKSAENYMKLKDGDNLKLTAQKMKELWPEKEMGYIFMIQAYSLLGQRADIDKEIEEIEKKKIYLTVDGREVIDYWKD